MQTVQVNLSKFDFNKPWYVFFRAYKNVHIYMCTWKTSDMTASHPTSEYALYFITCFKCGRSEKLFITKLSSANWSQHQNLKINSCQRNMYIYTKIICIHQLGMNNQNEQLNILHVMWSMKNRAENDCNQACIAFACYCQ